MSGSAQLAAPPRAQTASNRPATNEPLAIGGAQCSEASGYDKNRRYDAIIVGAGIAGLSAAKELEHLHRSILIIEANDRIGGRAYVGRIGDNKTPIDYGGAWIHGVPTNPLTPLVDAMGFKRTRTELNVPYYVDGKQADKEQMELFDNAIEEYESEVHLAAKAEEDQHAMAEYACNEFKNHRMTQKDICHQLEQMIPYSTIPASSDLCRLQDPPPSPERYCAMAQRDLRVTSDIAEDYVPHNPQFKDVLPLLIANSGPLETAAELSESSAVDAANFEAGEDDLVDKGMGTFVKAFGEGLPVCLNSRVTKINYSDQGVRVEVGNRVYTGSNALVTVSVGVLQAKKIVFEPALPAWKQDAIDHLQMGNMQKVIIPFKADVFPSERPNSWVLSEGDLPQAALTLARNERLPVVDDKKLVMALVIKPLGKNIAIGFFGGDWAKALEGQCEGKEKGSGKRSNSGCDSLAIAITKSALANIFGQEQINGSIQQSEIQVTRWSLDSTSFGAYSVAEPGSWEKHEILGEPVKDGIGTDRLFFAGEGTARAIYIGSYPGAYESGLKAAREIHAAMLESSGQTR